MSFRVDVVGTSFWAYFLHLPMLASHPQACHGYFAYADTAALPAVSLRPRGHCRRYCQCGSAWLLWADEPHSQHTLSYGGAFQGSTADPQGVRLHVLVSG